MCKRIISCKSHKVVKYGFCSYSFSHYLATDYWLCLIGGVELKLFFEKVMVVQLVSKGKSFIILLFLLHNTRQNIFAQIKRFFQPGVAD
jgi:hypothetical protein